MTTDPSGRLLSVRDIAAWQIPSVSTRTAAVFAELPALQRGAVWSAPQVEALWDSVLRGFPIGAFLLAPFQAERGTKGFRYRPEGVAAPQPTHHLLDGQQRSNALALGFLDPWDAAAQPAAPAALWLDLEAPAADDERDFVPRLLTRSHPWGFRYNALASEGHRLATRTIRDAVAAYEKAAPGLGEKSNGHVPLTHAWPWDAYAPVPLCFLLRAVEQGGDAREHLLKQLSGLPFWNSEAKNLHGDGWRERVTQILKASSGDDRDHVDRLLDAVKSLLGEDEATAYRIPGLVLPQLAASLSGVATRKVDREKQAERQDAVETLFIRINSGGTRLGGEELNYSILKSIWPDAEPFIQQMDVQLAAPSRLVSLASRLVLAGVDSFADKPPAAPDVTRFRRLIHGSDQACKTFQAKLLAFFARGTAVKVFHAARDLLTNNKGYSLPPVLAADIARRSPDVMFLLLRWVQRMLEEGHEPAGLNLDATHRVLGAVTALSWFAEDQARCLAALWQPLQTMRGTGLRSFFSARTFVRSYRLTKGKLGLFPLVPPDILKDALHANMFGHGFNTPAGWYWQSWTWERLTDLPLHSPHLGTKLDRWYKDAFESIWDRGEEEPDEVDFPGLRQQAWKGFVDKLWGEKSLLLFAQAKWIRQWFHEYDPTSVDPLDEADRPWDFDHIHPSSHVEHKKNVPRRIKAWHSSIGNLRAWPLQANRGDGASSPSKKLSSAAALETLRPFGITASDHLLDASFVDRDDLAHFERSTPDEDSSVPGYLGKPSEFGEQRKSLVRAIVGRWLRLYRFWYETLRIEDLGPLTR